MKLKRYPITALLLLVFGWAQAQTVQIAGNIKMDYCSADVEGVTVWALNSAGDTEATTTTDGDGNYLLELPAGEDYTIIPNANSTVLDGVSTFDFVLIERHIVGVQPFSSPYQIIAADVDNDESISTFDMFALRQVILAFSNTFPNNSSWRFIDAAYQFPDPSNPFLEDFPEHIQLNNVTADVLGADFVAVKIGDVNCTSSGTINVSGNTNYGIIAGNIYNDENANCSFDSGENTLSNWQVVAEGPGGAFTGLTNTNGGYTIFAPPGNYDISVVSPNALWQPCTSTYVGAESTFPPAADFDFGAEAVAECPFMNVDIGTSFLRRCFENQYIVQYCNQGTADATDAEVVVELDDFFENVGSTLPWSNVDGNTYTFPIGDVAVGECGSFLVTFDISCDAELEQTHCTSAHIYPNTSCLPANPLWSGADLEVTGECIDDEVFFILTNNGDDMDEPVEFVVLEDVMIQMTGETDVLLSGQSQNIPSPVITANGATFRINVNEVESHPFDLLNTVAVEGCGGFTPGQVSLFPEGDEEPYLDTDCRMNMGSWDPNDKRGFPLGLHDEHLIERGQAIEYFIRFQNTGTDTAFTVIIEDELDTDLDWTTMVPGASSHPYTYTLTSERQLIFVFDNIELPDSNVNEAASHGFVEFKIKQMPGLALGTAIENEAAIYFDYNEPVITNRTLHTIGEEFIEVTSTQTFVQNISLDVFPNPFETEATFRLEGSEWQAGTLLLFDSMGRSVHQQNFTGEQFTFDGSRLPAGLYFFKIMAGGKDVAAGKVQK